METANAGSSRKRVQKGQTLVEYGLVLLLIAVVVILMVKGVGLTTSNTYSSINSSYSSAAGR